MHWSQERFHADVTRAVGGTLNLLRELSRVAQEFDASTPAEWLIKRTLFFAYELQSEIPKDLSERERLLFLNRFFFEQKRFQCQTGPLGTLSPSGELENTSSPDPSEEFRLSSVLTSRRGSPVVLSLLYAFLAERIGVALEFVDFRPAWFLRWKENGRSRYIDVSRGGATLSSDELIEVLHFRYQLEAKSKGDALFEPISFEKFIVAYLSDLKSTLIKNIGANFGTNKTAESAAPEKLLFLQNLLIAYQPSNIQRLAERALIYRRLGNFKSALQDLKRYFAFNDREKSSPELQRLHDDLVKLTELRSPN